jgi:hypothetical protein
MRRTGRKLVVMMHSATRALRPLVGVARYAQGQWNGLRNLARRMRVVDVFGSYTSIQGVKEKGALGHGEVAGSVGVTVEVKRLFVQDDDTK